MSEETYMGVPRNTIDWSPILDYDKCNFCMECSNFARTKSMKSGKLRRKS